MKYLSEYFVALVLAFGALALTSIDVNAKLICGPNGCHHVYPHRSQWPVGGAMRTHWHNTAPYGCANVQRGQGLCRR
jgi:hypothetical protein